MADMQPQGEMRPDLGDGPRHEANEIKSRASCSSAWGSSPLA